MTKKKAKQKPTCLHNKGFTFKKTAQGVKRSCKIKGCHFSVTEIASGVFGVKTTPIKSYKKKKDADQESKPDTEILPADIMPVVE